MSQMLNLIRISALPSHKLLAAAKGNVGQSAVETLEILVHLAEHNRIFADTARLTLAGWDEASSKAVAGDPKAPKEILDYWLSPKNIRPALFPILLENPSVPVAELAKLATAVKGELADAMLSSPRLKDSPELLEVLGKNRELTPEQAARVRALVSRVQAEGDAPSAGDAEVEPANLNLEDPEADEAVSSFFSYHAEEIAAQPDQVFQPIGGFEEFRVEAPPQAAAATAVSAGPSQPTVVAVPQTTKRPPERRSALQKIALLDIKARIQLAIKGNKEERSILVRDGTKLVATAVLDSPKIGDGEVEKIATQRNVLEAVLRAIPMKRRFVKNYVVVRNLVFNPRTPIDVSLGLVKNLLLADLRNLSENKEVSHTVRKAGFRLFKQKSEANKQE